VGEAAQVSRSSGQVLREICLRHSNRQIAAPPHREKTVGHHVQHIYYKIGRSTRA